MAQKFIIAIALVASIIPLEQVNSQGILDSVNGLTNGLPIGGLTQGLMGQLRNGPLGSLLNGSSGNQQMPYMGNQMMGQQQGPFTSPFGNGRSNGMGQFGQNGGMYPQMNPMNQMMQSQMNPQQMMQMMQNPQQMMQMMQNPNFQQMMMQMAHMFQHQGNGMQQRPQQFV